MKVIQWASARFLPRSFCLSMLGEKGILVMKVGSSRRTKLPLQGLGPWGVHTLRALWGFPGQGSGGVPCLFGVSHVFLSVWATGEAKRCRKTPHPCQEPTACCGSQAHRQIITKDVAGPVGETVELWVLGKCTREREPLLDSQEGSRRKAL